MSPEQCVAEEVLALREARLNNADLIKWVPRPLTYAEGVRVQYRYLPTSILMGDRYLYVLSQRRTIALLKAPVTYVVAVHRGSSGWYPRPRQ